ncbi:uncharacterized protein LOC123037093 [Drosophila rhopaloa]|uniref:C2H2-type domain-containing protein n=1 Tax=Drosophila rhopaloa TaxID=1041015 RepID=A0ABM5J120_DRORH|nr:uncharacterized protein LOC123037093 [Drosophila rhopaloa]
MALIQCDVCNKDFNLSVFETHYEECSKPRNTSASNNKIICDLCYMSVDSGTFSEHYNRCLGPKNAFKVLMGAQIKNKHLQPISERQNYDDQPSTSGAAIKRIRTEGNSTQNTNRNKIKTSVDTNCELCGGTYPQSGKIKHIRSEKHKNAIAGTNKNVDVIHLASETEFPIRSYRIQSSGTKDIIDLKEFYKQCQANMVQILTHGMDEFKSIKFSIQIYGLYVKYTDDGDCVETYKHFGTAYLSVYDVDYLLPRIEEGIDYYSGWAIKAFKYFDITVIKLEHIPVRGYIPAPSTIKAKNALINVKNNDEYCFKWSLLAFIAFKSHALDQFPTPRQRRAAREQLQFPAFYRNFNISQEIIQYKEATLIFTGIEFPITKKGIKIFEKLNPNFSVNVYEIDATGKQIVGPVVRTDFKSRPSHINLLLIEKENSLHYAYITCMRTLCYSQCSKSRTPANFCENCLQFITTTNSTHDTKECGKVAATYPTPNSVTKFKNFYKKLSPPIVIYADIEAVLKNIHTAINTPTNSSTTKAQKHIACVVSFCVVHKYDSTLNKQWTYEGPDCIKQFCKALKDTTLALYNK